MYNYSNNGTTNGTTNSTTNGTVINCTNGTYLNYYKNICEPCAYAIEGCHYCYLDYNNIV